MKKEFYLCCALSFLFLPFLSCNSEGKDTNNERRDIVLTRSEQTILENQNKFAFELFRNLKNIPAGEKDKNFLLSPISVSQFLGLLANGMEGEALDEILTAVCPNGEKLEDFNALNRSLSSALMMADKQTSLLSANSVWVSDKYPIKSDYVDNVRTYYDAVCSNVDFDSPADIAKISNWVTNATKGMVSTDFLRDPIIKILFANAMYFKGEWTHPFDEKHTTKENFKNYDGRYVTINMMKKSFDDVLYVDTDNYKAVSIPYGNEAFSMFAILPSENIDLGDFISSFDNNKWIELRESMYKASDVAVSLPKFEVKSELQIDALLKSVGINKLFSKADVLAGISDEMGAVPFAARQDCVLRLGETGVEAATLTRNNLVSLDPSSKIEKIINLNRPFIYLIEEQSTGAIIYIGEIHKL